MPRRSTRKNLILTDKQNNMSSPEKNAGAPEAPKRFEGELNKDIIKQMYTLEVDLEANFDGVLGELRQRIGVDLQPRAEGYHITIIGTNDYKVINGLDDEKIAELQKISEQIKRGEGVIIKGIGYIDGSSSGLKMRENDKEKRVAFLAVDIPELQNFRKKVGLPAKDFHITLGFVGGDIHSHVVRQEPVKPNSPKMKDVLEPIPKKADEKFGDISLPEIKYERLGGQIK